MIADTAGCVRSRGVLGAWVLGWAAAKRRSSASVFRVLGSELPAGRSSAFARETRDASHDGDGRRAAAGALSAWVLEWAAPKRGVLSSEF
jgi:hypothetical protein